MALNPETIKFFLSRISNASIKSFGSEVGQLFNNLKDEIKDNPIYDLLMNESSNWDKWIDDASYSIGTSSYPLPSEYQKAKSLAFAI
jgi:hypothetical protein